MVYGEPHDCPGRDSSKSRLLVALVAGAVLGAPAGHAYGQSVITRACSLPGAGNLCGLADSFAQPVYVIIGAAVGMCAAALIVLAVSSR